MAINYSQIQDQKNPFFGRADDPRKVIKVICHSDATSDDERTWDDYCYNALVINPDFTLDSVKVAHHRGYGYALNYDCRKVVVVDATPEDLQRVREKSCEGVEAHYFPDNDHRGVKPGDTLEVVKGRKFPRGTRFMLSEVREYRDCWGRYLADYAYGTNGIKVNIANCIAVGFGNGDLPEIKVGNTVEVVKDIINPSTGEVKYTAGTTVEVARFEITSWNGREKEYIIGTKGEKIFKAFACLV